MGDEKINERKSRLTIRHCVGEIRFNTELNISIRDEGNQAKHDGMLQ